MRTTQQYSITLPIEMAAMIERKIEEGYYASMSEAVRDGIRTLMDRDQVIDQWLRNQIAPNIQARKNENAKTFTVEEVHHMLDQDNHEKV
jgi:putative addiction module CopG family antidote